MLKIIAAGLAAFVLLFAWVAITSDGRGVQAGDPVCDDGLDGTTGTGEPDGLIDEADPDCATATATVAPTATEAATATAAPSATAAPTGTAAAGTATPTRIATAAVTPAAVPGTGGEPGSSTNLLLILALGAGVVAGTAGLAGITVTRRS